MQPKLGVHVKAKLKQENTTYVLKYSTQLPLYSYTFLISVPHKKINK